ncbi:MAG: hypothetical protein EA342_10905 [Leptolyngbya sp. LCM1.Bin17]|nr:MAG: hypothetical protein EA342_10905 [Leptolyngbya sp. LCM1.Bin17]
MQNALTRYRRSPVQAPTLRLITFQLRHNGFCLPLALARRVIFQPAEDPSAALGLTQLNHENIPIVDIARRVYQQLPLLSGSSPTELSANPCPAADQTIVVVECPGTGPVGLRVDSIPTLRRAKAAAFSPVPATYLIMNHLQGINTLVTLEPNEAPLFLLDLDALLC